MDGNTLPPARICFPYAGVELGGSHISSLGLIRRLDRSRFEPKVVLRSQSGPVYELFRDHGIPVDLAPETPTIQAGKKFSIASIFKAASSFPILSKYLRENDIDIVHGNDGRTNAMWGVPAKLSGAKFVWHQRSAPSSRGLRYVAPFLADRVITVSKFASPPAGLISAASKNSVIYSPFNIDLHEDRNDARAELLKQLDCRADTKFVGYFGNIVKRKRPLVFLDAIAALLKQAPEIPIMGLLFGAPIGGFEDEVREYANTLGITENIRLMGFRSPGSQWLSACDLLMVTSIEEPFGRALVEAMLLETPIVATDSGGNPEAIRHEETGLLAPPEDASALADCAARLLRNPEMTVTITQSAKADAKARFGEEKHAGAVMALYDELLGRREV